MGNAANFTVIRDAWTDDLTDGADFSISSSIDQDRRPVMTFMVKNQSGGDATLAIRINGKKVWDWHYTQQATRCYQEVLETDVLRPGDNRINVEIDLTSDGDFDYAAFTLSDIVVWYRVNI